MINKTKNSNCQMSGCDCFTSCFQIFLLEKQLAEAQRLAGLPVQVPTPATPHSTDEALKKENISSDVITKTTTPLVQSTPTAIQGNYDI